MCDKPMTVTIVEADETTWNCHLLPLFRKKPAWFPFVILAFLFVEMTSSTIHKKSSEQPKWSLGLRCRMREHYFPRSSRTAKVQRFLQIQKEILKNILWHVCFMLFCHWLLIVAGNENEKWKSKNSDERSVWGVKIVARGGMGYLVRCTKYLYI